MEVEIYFYLHGSNDTMITQDTTIQSKTSWQYPL